jgi:hypothetical protein
MSLGQVATHAPQRVHLSASMVSLMAISAKGGRRILRIRRVSVVGIPIAIAGNLLTVYYVV